MTVSTPLPGTFISNLPTATSLTGTEIVPIVQAGTTKTTTTSGIAGLTGLGGSGGSSLGVWTHVTSNHTAVAGEQIFADTFSGALTITLPNSPNVGDTVVISDFDGNWGTHNATVNPGTGTYPPGFNPFDIDTHFSLSNRNRTFTCSGGSGTTTSARGFPYQSAGKLYFEFFMNNSGAVDHLMVGLAQSNFSLNGGAYIGQGVDSIGVSDTFIGINFTYTGALNFTTNDTVQIAIDFTAQKFWAAKNNNGNWNAVAGNPATGAGSKSFSLCTPPFAPAATMVLGGTNTSATVNLTSSQCSFSPPSGFSFWTTDSTLNTAAGLIEGATSLVLDVTGGSVTLVWIGQTVGWKAIRYLGEGSQ